MAGEIAVRVLLAEDEPDLAAMMEETLAEEGWQVDHAETLEDALARVGSERFDVIVADGFGPAYLEPDPTDRAALRALAARAPVLVASGRAWAQRVAPADLGVAAILAKPFGLEAFVRAVRRAAVSARKRTPERGVGVPSTADASLTGGRTRQATGAARSRTVHTPAPHARMGAS
jgi:DNA-binding response OmpR family regulator